MSKSASVTSIIGNVLAAPALEKWKRRIIVDRWIAEPSLPVALSIDGVTDIRKQLLALPYAVSKPAAHAGVAVHQAVEVLCAGRSLPPSTPESLVDAATTIMRRLDRAGLRPIATEVRVWDDRGYRGRADIVAVDRGGQRWVLEVKTGSALWPSAALQVTAYATAGWWNHRRPRSGPVAARAGLLHMTNGACLLSEVDLPVVVEAWEHLLALHGFVDRRPWRAIREKA